MHVGVFLLDSSPDLGGGHTFTYDVFSKFLDQSASSTHRFTIFCSPAVADQLSSRRLPENVRVDAVRRRGPLALLVSALRHYAPLFGFLWKRPCRLERQARKLGVELMWFVGGFYDTLDIPYICTVWDVQHLTHPWFPEISSKWQWEYRELFFTRHLRRATYVITGTEVGRRELMEFYRLPRQRIRILPHPTPSFVLSDASSTHEEGKALLERYGLRPDYLIYPAQIWAHKNHVNLLLALKALRDAGDPVPDLALVGSDRGNRTFVEKQVRALGLANNVRFLGFVPLADLIALYRHARALVYPSFSGPENLPPLEAFALGCPVVASDYPGAHEQLEDAVVYFNPADPQGMSVAIRSVLTNPGLRQSLIAKGKTRAQRWTSREYVQGVFRMMDEFAAIRRCWDNQM